MRRVHKLIRRTALKRDEGASFLEVLPDLVSGDLGVVDADDSLLGLEVLDERDGSRFTSVTSVGLESETENSNAL